jgi:hypothetical protein
MLGPAMTGNPCRLHPAQMLSRNGPGLLLRSPIIETSRDLKRRRRSGKPGGTLSAVGCASIGRLPRLQSGRASVCAAIDACTAQGLRVCSRFGCLYSLFGPVSALAFGLRCSISLFGALADFGTGRLQATDNGELGHDILIPAATLRAVQDANRAGKPAADHHPTCPAIARSERRSQS